MGRYSKIKNSNQNFEVINDQTFQSKKIQKCITKIKNSEIGKPPALNTIKLEEPNIWSSNIHLINIVNFFLGEGRHFLLHLAGAKRSSERKQDSQGKSLKRQDLDKIKQKQPLFEFLESFSVNLLGMPKRNKNKERIVVFFFRCNRIYNLKGSSSSQLTIKSENWNWILKQIKFLFDNQFYQELIEILHLLENQNNIESVADNLINKFKQSDCLEKIQVIFKNLLIQIIKNNEDQFLNKDTLNLGDPKQILQVYKQQMNQYQYRVIQFIQKLKSLFDCENKDKVQDSSYQQQKEVDDYNSQQFDPECQSYQLIYE